MVGALFHIDLSDLANFRSAHTLSTKDSALEIW